MLVLDGPAGQQLILEEDDCGAAYAYLLDDQRIVGDVWLYNVVAGPIEAPRTGTDRRPPFLNPQSLTKPEEHRRRIGRPVTVEARWSEGTVEVFFDGRLEARLWEGAKPGQAFMAAASGPLARTLPGE